MVFETWRAYCVCGFEGETIVEQSAETADRELARRIRVETASREWFS